MEGEKQEGMRREKVREERTERVKVGYALYPGDDFVSCERCLSSCFRQYQDFLEDLEEDEALRKNVNIFRGE